MKMRGILELLGLLAFRPTVGVPIAMVAVALALPAAAGAGWGVSQPVSGEGSTIGYVDMDSSPDGRSFVVWSQEAGGNDLIHGVQVNAAGVPGDVITLSTVGQDAVSPAVAVDADGSATVAWARSNGANVLIQSTRVSPSGEKGPILNRSATGNNAGTPQLDYSDNGSVGLVWRRYDGADYIVQSRVIHADGSADSIRDLSTDGLDAKEPAIVGTPGGTFRTVWIEGAADSTSNVITKTLTPDGAPGQFDPVSTVGNNPGYLDLEANSSGDAVVVWQRYDNEAGHWGAAMARIPFGQSPEEHFWVAPPHRDAFEPQVGLADSGVALVVWAGFQLPEAAYFTEARRVNQQNALGEPLELDGPLSTMGYPMIDTSPAGWSSVVWGRPEPVASSSVQSARVSPAGFAGETERVSAAADFANNPLVTVADDGIAASAYPGYILNGGRFVFASRYTDPGAEISPPSGAFGDRLAGAGPGTPQTFTITSSGSTPNDFQSIGLTGPNAAEFQLTGADSCLGSRSAGFECQVNVAFAPSSSGEKQASIKVMSGAGERSVALTGRGTVPATSAQLTLKVRPAAKKVKRGKKTKLKVTVRNTGDAAATGVKLCFRGKAKIVNPKKKCVSFGNIAATGAKAKMVKAGLSKKAKRGKKYPLRFKLNAANAPAKKATVKLRAR